MLAASLYKAGSEIAHLTLQDWFVKGTPLDNMLSIDVTDAWLDKFISNFKHRFTRPADPLKVLTFQYELITYSVDFDEEISK